MRAALSALRPRQWTKNLLVFAGLIFSGRFSDPESVRIAVLTFAAFCLVSSAGYLVNDVVDRELDRQHPEKRHRAIASGRLSVSLALILACALLVLGGGAAWAAGIGALGSLAFYAANQGFYVLLARSVPILDVFVIAIGFLIRAVAGAVALSVTISPWLLLCTLMLALFLGFCKRRHELQLESNARPSLGGYSLAVTDQFIAITAACTVLTYSLYAIQSETAQHHAGLYLTIPFPLFGVFRYLQLVHAKGEGGNPDETLIRDPWIAGTVLAWIAVALLVMSDRLGGLL
ncbi:MAG: decaprenyl-phosphate phosphoribosyltransferase [Fimbriimonadales bacterium]|nr:MAG: decaprenyl-phosphate phosphoribosyltransferase [Fimbriimonadales bacterium]